jgi:hypothetical protein
VRLRSRNNGMAKENDSKRNDMPLSHGWKPKKENFDPF